MSGDVGAYAFNPPEGTEWARSVRHLQEGPRTREIAVREAWCEVLEILGVPHGSKDQEPWADVVEAVGEILLEMADRWRWMAGPEGRAYIALCDNIVTRRPASGG